MLLHTPLYLLYLVIVVGLYWLLPAGHPRKLFLLAVSYTFYLFINPSFPAILLILTLATFWLGRVLPGSKHPRRILVSGLIVNLGALGIFKYLGFFLDSLSAGLSVLGIHTQIESLQFLLPAGISFYTFQAVSYLMEIYRRKIQPSADLVDFSLYLAFFPKIIAGPLVRPHQFFEQLSKPAAVFDRNVLPAALGLLLSGLFKKVVIADSLAVQSQVAFQAAALSAGDSAFPTPLYIFGFYLYAFQIYADFSGYTDLARGSAALLGIQLPENFQQPYLSVSLAEFWNRWHMSLTQWFREYLFFPLSRSLLVKSGRRFQRPIQIGANLLTMILIGLWHGAGWTYIAWGAWHGLLLSLEHLLNLKTGRNWVRLIQGLITFHLVGIGWVLFRADSFVAAGTFLRGLLDFDQMVWLPHYLPAILLTAALVFAIDLAQRWQLIQRYAGVRSWQALAISAALVLLAGLFLLDLARGGQARPFIYGQY